MNTINIEYIGHRNHHVDGIYGTRIEWAEAHDVQPVPASVAMKMLRNHPDVYRLSEQETGKTVAEAIEEDAKASEEEAARQAEDGAVLDQVQRMTKDKLVDFSQAKFGKPLDKRRSVDSLRAEVTNMIDLYGLP